MILLGKPFRIRLGQSPEEWIENNFIGTEKWAVEYAMAIVARQKPGHPWAHRAHEGQVVD